ncbi:MAG TPA: hypothetical protein VGG48_20145 [Rhizomicrobium sp.]|jgi:hypothetical protein
MKRMIAVCAVPMLLAGAAHADPLAPARAGLIQCFHPDKARKICGAMGRYSFDSKGGIISHAEVLLSPDHFVVMKSDTPEVIRGEADCGVVRAPDIDAAAMYDHGMKMKAEQAAPVRAMMKIGMGGQFGKEICSTYARQPDGSFRVTQTVDGQPRPEHDRVIWVRPDEGYRVAP